MSILIKGMEMPKRCVGCPLFVCEIGDPMSCLVGYRRLDERNVNESRPDWCPLVPLPDKHGRLGDLDDLETTVIDAIETGFTAVDILLGVRTAPTIIEAEGGGEDGS